MKFRLQEKRKRAYLYLLESKHTILKSITKNPFFKKSTKLNTRIKLSILLKLSIRICLVNRCILTDRKNRFNFHYRFSRLLFLKLARNKEILGLKRHSW